MDTGFVFNDIFCPYYPTPTESNKTCSRAVSQVREQWPFNPHECSNYIFHTGSSYFHRTLSCDLYELGIQMEIYSHYIQRSTAVKLAFEESINRCYSVGSCWCPRACITSLQHTRSFFWEKKFFELILVSAKETYFSIFVEKIPPF